MDQNKPNSPVIAAVKPAGASSVAAVKPAGASASPAPASSGSSTPAAKKVAPKKAAAKKPAAKKAAPKKTAAKKTTARKTTARKSPARKTTARKTAASRKPAAKKATGSVWGTKKPAFAPAAKGTKQAADQFLQMGTEAFQSFFGASTASDAKKLSEKAFGFGKDGADQLAKSADAATRSINEVVSISQDNLEACVESGNIAADMSKAVSEEIFEFTNDLFSKNIELSKKAFACRTINDVFELQSKAMKANIDNIFNETAKISEMTFKMASKASEPINERVAETSKRLSKTFAA